MSANRYQSLMDDASGPAHAVNLSLQRTGTDPSPPALGTLRLTFIVVRLNDPEGNGQEFTRIRRRRQRVGARGAAGPAAARRFRRAGVRVGGGISCLRSRERDELPHSR